MKRKRVGGDEQDAFSRYWRRITRWQPGELSRLKRKANKRERREARAALRTPEGEKS